MKRVLIISYYWPPAGGSGVQRWVKFTKYLPENGWQPVVYTPLNPEIISLDESLLRDIPPEAEIVKTKITEPYAAYRRLMGSKTSKEVNPISSADTSFKKRVSLFIRGNFFIPDPRVWWVRSSVKFLKKYLKEHPVDVIVTTGPPQSMHLIGQKLARETGLPWIPDFRDPWTKMFYFKHLHLTRWAEKKHHRLEKEVLDEATAVIAVTPFVQKDFQEMTRTRIEMITNGFDEDDYPLDSVSASEKFTITHTGLFAADGNPLVLWDCLKQMCETEEGFRDALQIRLAGKVDAEILQAIDERGLPVENLGYLTHEDAVKEQRSASVLILPLRQDPEYLKVLPGKIFEYLASRRPIIGIGQTDGAAAIVLKDADAGVMVGWDDKEKTMQALQKAWNNYKSGSVDKASGSIDKYSRRALTARLAKLLEEVCR